MRRFLGGGPYGRSLDHWKEVSPVLSADRLRVPLLMEYSDAILSGLEMHQAIVEQGGQAELVLYPMRPAYSCNRGIALTQGRAISTGLIFGSLEKRTQILPSGGNTRGGGKCGGDSRTR
jgi:hypothetical protein